MASNSKTQIRRNNEISTVDDIVLRGIMSVVESLSMAWRGTMTELFTDVNRMLSKKQRLQSPGSPSALRVVLNRIVNRLRSRGISVKFGRASDGTRFVRLAQ